MPFQFNKNIINTKKWTPPINRKDYLKLDLNENYSLFDDKFLKKFKNFDKFIVSCYPEYDKFLSLLSKYVKQPSKNIAVTNGGDQAIELLLRLFFNAESKILMPSPVFSIYDHVFGILGSKVDHIPYDDKDNYFDFPADKVLEYLSGFDGVVLCNPNNPLGSVIEEKYLLKIIEKTNELNIPCVIDEAYYEFYGKTSSSLIKKYKNIIIIRTFSKMFGLAGLRLGYVLADKSVVDELLKIRGPWDVNHFAVFAGEIVLRNISYFSKKLKDFLSIKKDMENLLIKNNFKIYKTNTNFLVIKSDNHNELIKRLKNSNVLVNDISEYSFSLGLLSNAVRITIPSNRKDLDVLEKAIIKK